MARKFMIVKPSFCCGSVDGVCDGVHEVEIVARVRSTCESCGHVDTAVMLCYDKEYCVFESRVTWLPDEKDIISHDMLKEITA